MYEHGRSRDVCQWGKEKEEKLLQLSLKAYSGINEAFCRRLAHSLSSFLAVAVTNLERRKANFVPERRQKSLSPECGVTMLHTQSKIQWNCFKYIINFYAMLNCCWMFFRWKKKTLMRKSSHFTLIELRRKLLVNFYVKGYFKERTTMLWIFFSDFKDVFCCETNLHPFYNR